VALVMRPVGGAVFGNFGDKYGRKKIMVITIMGFSIVTFVTGWSAASSYGLGCSCDWFSPSE
jgi:MFS family permease